MQNEEVKLTIIGNDSHIVKGDTDKNYLILGDNIDGNNPNDCVVIEMTDSIIIIGNRLLGHDLGIASIISKFIEENKQTQ